MNKKLTSWLFSSFLLAVPLSLQAQYHSQVWNPDNGNGTYTNPVIYADYSDPDVVAGKFSNGGKSSAMPCRNRNPRNSSISLSMARVFGLQPSAITMESSISIGVIPTTASSW